MQHLAQSYPLRFCNENQLKSNKEYGNGLYDILVLMRTDQEKARYTFLEEETTQLGPLIEPRSDSSVSKVVQQLPRWRIVTHLLYEGVDYLVEDNAMDDICLSPELDGTLVCPLLDTAESVRRF
jgi:DNA-directed RNA polymerase-5 subunit 1